MKILKALKAPKVTYTKDKSNLVAVVAYVILMSLIYVTAYGALSLTPDVYVLSPEAESHIGGPELAVPDSLNEITQHECLYMFNGEVIPVYANDGYSDIPASYVCVTPTKNYKIL